MAEVRELHAAGSSLRQRLLEVKAAEADTLRRSGRREAAALTGLRRRLDGDVRRIEGSAADLGEGVRRLRLIPVEVALAGLPRLVRDTAAALGKQVRVEVAGARTEADRGVLDALGGVLGHLVRNCVDHGIEDPQTRRAAGKDPTGVVSVRVAEQGTHLLLTIADDGAGIDRESVAARAAAAGLIPGPGSGAAPDALDLIFHPGLSTARTVTEHSGRGVGLDAVASAVSALGGTVSVASTPGEGTTFTLTLPAGMATTQCLLLGVGGRGMALPVAAVARVVRIEPDTLGQVGGRKVLAGEGTPTVVVELAEVIGWAAPAPTVAGRRRLAVLGQSAGTGVGLLVDEIGGEEDLVVKPLPAPLPPSRLTRGVAILGSGEVVAVLGAAEVFRAAAVHGSPAAGPPSRPALPPRPVVVVADDSFTTRTMLRTILAAAGYDVRAAADGQEAVDLVLAGGCDAVVTDVEMPRLDGFGVCARLRSEPTTREVPVVLVTGLASDADRRRGVDVGADAYIVKGDFDQGELLETLRRLLP